MCMSVVVVVPARVCINSNQAVLYPLPHLYHLYRRWLICGNRHPHPPFPTSIAILRNSINTLITMTFYDSFHLFNSALM